uniref:Family with sequence similarity 126 member A n=1 Tax=Cyprinus carpio TaxID=7962 RepID=A0A8C2EZX3_CYPCA
SGEPRLQRFTLQFLPELVWSYLSVTAARDPHCSGCIEALLLGIYNLVRALLNNTLHTSSVNHPDAVGSEAAEQNTEVSRHDCVECVSTSHHKLDTFAISAEEKVCICGYPRQQVRRYKGISSRLMVTSEFLVQLITGIHFALCNGEVELGSRALDDVLYRAQLDLFPEALLVCFHAQVSRLLNGEALRSRTEGEACDMIYISLSKTDTEDIGSPDELTEIKKVEEGICTQACAAPSSPPTIVISSSGGGGKLSGKGLRRLTGRSSKDKDKDAASGAEQLTRKQAAVRAMSENLELLSLKRLTLTASQSVPKSGSLSLSRTASAVFSRSFEQVSNVLSSNHVAEVDHGGVAYLEHLSPAHQHRQRSPTISVHVTSDP